MTNKTKLIISVSGIRGIVGDSLTVAVAQEMGQAYGSALKAGDKLVVGGDTRISYNMLSQALIAGILATGVDVINIGQCPTPTVQHAIRRHQAQGGLVITASHNPIAWNGIKLMNDQGAFLIGAGYDKIIDNFHQKTFRQVDATHVGQEEQDKQAIDKHIDVIFEAVDPAEIKQSKLRVLIDVNHGTGAIADPILFDRLGIDYELMYPQADGKFSHTPEPVKENLTAICERLKAGNFDIGFAQDPDADRLITIAGDGTFIGEDYSLAYCLDYLLAQDKSPKKDIVVNLSTSKVIEYLGEKHQATVYYSKIGEPNVTAKLQDLNAQFGGEGNGGVIYPRVGWGRDSLLGMVVALKHLATSKKTVLETVQSYPSYNMYRDKMALDNRADIQPFLDKLEANYPQAQQNHEDGIKFDFGKSWLHVRASNTEPILRLFAEAETLDQAKVLVEQAKALR
eukprot:COSAG01_NODE_1_length_100484_cov_170.446142_31_plen_453_part_00